MNTRHVARVDVVFAVLAGQQGVDGEPAEPAWPPVQHEHVDHPLEEREERHHHHRHEGVGQLPVADGDSRASRADQVAPSIHGDGWRQNSRPASARVKAFAPSSAHRGSSSRGRRTQRGGRGFQKVRAAGRRGGVAGGDRAAIAR